MAFDLNKEKLRCFMVLDDDLAMKLVRTAGPAYWRGFIMEDRETHLITAVHRFSYADGAKSWFGIKVKEQIGPEEAIHGLCCALEDAIKIALSIFGVEPAVTEEAVYCFYPPDDEGEPTKTMIWLEQQGLVEIEINRRDESEGPLDGE